MPVYVANFLQTLKKCLIVMGPKRTATIKGNVIDIIYEGGLEIHTVLTYCCSTCGVARPFA